LWPPAILSDGRGLICRFGPLQRPLGLLPGLAPIPLGLPLPRLEGAFPLILIGLDALLVPALDLPHQQQLACEIGMSQKQRNGVLAAVTGFPSITVPAGYAESEHAPVGVPVGLEMLGRPYSENLLVDCAYAYEQIHPVRRPPVLK